MKKQIKQQIPTTDNFISYPPWTRCKTKEQAWQKGYEAGQTAGALQEQRDLASREKAVRSVGEEHKIRALSDICQAGSTVVESMSKALLSYMNNL